MAPKSFAVGMAVLAVAVLSGCAATRSEVKLSSPGAAASAPATGRVVVIRSVKDERVFEESPREPSTPSLGSGGAAAAPAEVKARAIGRKRGAYGMAMGDVLLEPGKNVEAVVRENLAAALTQAGFQVRESASGGGSPLLLDVRVRKFWAWLTPGAFAMAIEAVIETDIAAVGAAPVSVSVRHRDTSMLVTDEEWIRQIDKALQEYRAQAASKVGGWR